MKSCKDQPGQTSVDRPERQVRIYTVADLFKGDRVIVLKHGGADYQLRITKAGKLILTK